MADPIKTPISQGVIDRVVRGIKYVVSGADPDAWFSPSQPLPPFAQKQAVGRQFDYQTGYNLQQQPKVYEGITFSQLRQLADSLDILRLVIETRKDMLCKMKFIIKPTDATLPQDERCKAIQEFFRFPDQEHSWDEWLRMLLEDLFVTDAPALYPRLTNGGEIYALEPMDGATVKRVIDGQGRTPSPPEVAYQQILKGVPAVDYSKDELIYKPRNLRTNKVYGYSPVEQILMTVNVALRRQVSQLQYYSEGDAVDRIMSVPAEWNPDQVAQFREYWSSMLAGNTGQRRQTMFVPHGVSSVNTKENLLKDDYDEWLARIICYAFSIAPSAFVKQMNRATASTAKISAEEEGLQPIQQWIKNLVDYVILKYFGYTDLEFQWEDESVPDPLVQAQVNQIYINAGVKTPNEVRESLGLNAIDEVAESKPFISPKELPNKSGATKMGADSPNAATAAKVEKSAKKPVRGLAPLNRDRPKIRRTRVAINASIKNCFKKQAPKIIGQIKAKYSELGKSDESRATAEKILSTIFINWDELASELEPYLSEMAIDGVREAAIQIQLDNIGEADVNLAFERAEDFARARGAELVGKKWVEGALIDNPDAEWSITEATRTMLASDVTTAIEEGWSTQQLAQTLEDNYAFSSERAETIARTETAAADVQGNMEAYREAADNGIEVLKKWITANDDLVSVDCAMNGESDPIGLDEAFPSGASEPPEHPNCRCDILPVLMGED